MSTDRIVTLPTTILPGQPARTWQESMRLAIRDARQLCEYLRIEPRYSAPESATGPFPTFVPPEFMARMVPGDPDDPLLLQVLPQIAEFQPQPNATTDPVGDRPALIGGGLIHRYPGRALLVVHATCAAHCRYCFRRHFPYQSTGPQVWQQALRQLRARADVDELILSGGDPLTVSDHKLRWLITSAAEIPTLRRLRIHTRLPILIPQRVTEHLLRILRESRLRIWLVIHANHPRELDATVMRAVSELRNSGIPVLNQSVLLRRVNDDLPTLAELSLRLVDMGVVPYYLHQLDRVIGAAHFEVPVSQGRALVRQLRQQLPGYAVPRYVADRPGSSCKTVLL